MARQVSMWSKDPGTQVGAVLVEDRRILSTGYNGLPRGMADDERLQDRDFKLTHTIHAELNAILNASRSGIRLEGSSMYVWGLNTCPDCAKAIIQAGIREVHMCVPIHKPDWADAFRTSSAMYAETGVSWYTYTRDWVDSPEDS